MSRTHIQVWGRGLTPTASAEEETCESREFLLDPLQASRFEGGGGSKKRRL